MARIFLERAVAAGERRFLPVDCGFDGRYRREALAGTALAHLDEGIHSAFFQLETARSADANHMVSLRNRRRNHRE